MNKIIVFFIIFCNIFSSTQYSNFSLENKNNLWYKEGSNTPFTGIYYKKFPNKDIVFKETEYKDGNRI
ncbi:hypothetical protein [Fusobacterium sp. PH5-44]|uniref:hypothetical protein n=1 Tax=unclassified Fusobacterium TaxID=2648384 RepID=UPI003D1F4F73